MKIKDRRNIALAILEMNNAELLEVLEMTPPAKTMKNRHNLSNNEIRAEIITFLDSKYRRNIVKAVLGVDAA